MTPQSQSNAPARKQEGVISTFCSIGKEVLMLWCEKVYTQDYSDLALASGNIIDVTSLNIAALQPKSI